jgi:HAD superfamily hydrolase (TIGR01490 family)
MKTDQPRKFAVFDIDGTLIRWQLYHAIVDELVTQGSIKAANYQAVEQARDTWKRRGHVSSFDSYEQALIKVHDAAVDSLSIEDYQKAVDAVFEAYKDQVYTYTRDLIRSLKQEGYVLLAISGSHQDVIQKLAEYYGFDEAVGPTYGRKDGHITRPLKPVYGRKAIILKELVKKHDLSYEGSIAIGDSATDIDILKLVEKPIAFNPTRDLFAHAKAQHWQIVIERKNVIYELEADKHGGYRLV